MERRVLLLTNWFFPIRILRWRTAITYLYKGMVETVAEYPEEVRSPSVVWKMPAVVRMRKDVPSKRTRVRYSKAAVFQRDNFCCQYCRHRFPRRELTIDHVIPRSQGGRTTYDNVVTACRPCNMHKDDRSCDESGMFPWHLPAVPKELPIHMPPLPQREVPEEWVPFVGNAIA